MIIETRIVGPLQVNCYIVGCETTRHAVVIDPGDDAANILASLRQNRLTLNHILVTHGHFDHLGGAQQLKELMNARLCLHSADLPLVRSYSQQAARFGLRVGPPPKVDDCLNDGDEITIGIEKLCVMHTPGHSPGGVSFVGNGMVFVGDVLFRGTIGRTDLLGGNYEMLINTIRTRLFSLSDEVLVYPGHGPMTSIGYERLNNRFFQ